MSTFTLTFDESGGFDTLAGETAERHANIVGGLLCPGDANALGEKWSPVLEELAAAHPGLPQHSTDLRKSDRGTLTAYQTRIGREATDSQATWLFVVAPPHEDVVFSYYLRIASTLVDLAGRLAGMAGATALDVRPAQRSRTLPSSRARDIEKQGLGLRQGTDDDGTSVSAFAQADVRVTMESLHREGGPRLGSCLVRSGSSTATSAPPHPGLTLADFGCNFVRTRVAQATFGSEWPGFANALVVDYDRAPQLQELDRLFRQPTPDIVRAARIVAALEGDAAGGNGRYPLAVQGTAKAAGRLFDMAMHVCLGAPPKQLGRVAALLAASARGALDSKSGAYEGVWRALHVAWADDGELARRVRASVHDREVQAHLWRLTLECANHRGDVDTAGRAVDAFEEIRRHGHSLALMAQTLAVRNLHVVCVQNVLPQPDGHAAARDALERVTKELGTVVDEAHAISGVADRLAKHNTRHSAVWSEADRTLWKLTGAPPPAEVCPDRERGHCLGTIARSLAFLGRHKEAVDRALEARALFSGDDFDLGFNAAVIARILLDEARLGDLTPERIRSTQAALELAGALALEPDTIARAIEEEPGRRFALDLLLRALLWAPDTVAKQRSRWLEQLRPGAKATLYAAVSEGDRRSHPSELVARHAGELCAGDARRDWFLLSLDLSTSSTDGTLRAMGVFTQLLLDGKAAGGGAGCILNPVFEYR